MRIGSLFSGTGALDMAVEAVFPDARPAWFCEWDDAPSKILAHHWPDVPNLRDVTAVDWTQVEPVDILTGGFPCQDVSSAGKKAGVNGGKRSGLWTNMARAIGDLRPELVIVENVRELAVRGLDRVLGDLTALGYDAEWTSLPACAVGAPFRRVRMFITASPAGTDRSGLRRIAQRHSVAQQTSPIRLEWQQRHADRLALEDKRSLDRWARILGRPAPDPVGWGVNGQPRLNPGFSEWLMGLPAGHVTDPDIGLTRNQQLKALGNGVVPQQGAAALEWLLSDLAVPA